MLNFLSTEDNNSLWRQSANFSPVYRIGIFKFFLNSKQLLGQCVIFHRAKCAELYFYDRKRGLGQKQHSWKQNKGLVECLSIATFFSSTPY